MYTVTYKDTNGGLFGDSMETRTFSNYQSARVFARVKKGTITRVKP